MRDLTREIGGQYPRPWITDSTSPHEAQVFTVGVNQHTPYPVEAVGAHEPYVDALFNRGSKTGRELYRQIADKVSTTRRNTDELVRKLKRYGIDNVLETNVICYATPMSRDLARPEHREGEQRGRKLFKALVEIIEPKVLIAHGAKTAKKLGRVLACQLPRPPKERGDPVQVRCGDMTVFVVPSLAPPGYNMWARWADEHLDAVARRVAAALREPTA